MENDILFRILKKGYERGIYNSVSITDLFKEAVIKDGADKTKPTDWETVPSILLGSLKKENFIKYQLIIDNDPEITEIPDNWLDLINVTITLQPDGLLFYYKKLEIDQLIKSNNLGKKNIIAIFTLAVLSFLVSVYTAVKDSVGNADKPHKSIVNSQQQPQTKDSVK